MGHHEVAYVPVLGKTERILVCAVLNVVRLPLPSPVTVRVVVASAVLVHAAITIVVDPFGAEYLVVAELVGLYREELARVGRIFLVTSLRALADHVGNVAV